jgi:hypothetical protein
MAKEPLKDRKPTQLQSGDEIVRQVKKGVAIVRKRFQDVLEEIQRRRRANQSPKPPDRNGD